MATRRTRLLSHNFAEMFFKSNSSRKAFSALVLVLLLFIHSVKLLHSHPANSFLSNHGCSKAAIDIDIDRGSGNVNSSDCGICSYQLNKDADGLAYYPTGGDLTEQNIFRSQLISFHKFTFPAVFENRGPPSFI